MVISSTIVGISGYALGVRNHMIDEGNLNGKLPTRMCLGPTFVTCETAEL